MIAGLIRFRQLDAAVRTGRIPPLPAHVTSPLSLSHDDSANRSSGEIPSAIAILRIVAGCGCQRILGDFARRERPPGGGEDLHDGRDVPAPLPECTGPLDLHHHAPCAL